MKNKAGFLLLTAIILCVSSLVQADVTYNYTGNAMHCTGGVCPVDPLTLTGSLTLSSALASNLFFGPVTPTSYTFVVSGTAFSQQFTQADPGPDSFAFITNGSGVITGWQISFAGTLQTAYSVDFIGGGDSYANSTGAAWTEGNSSPGTWTVGSPVPEPSSLILLASGAMGLLGVIRRKMA